MTSKVFITNRNSIAVKVILIIIVRYFTRNNVQYILKLKSSHCFMWSRPKKRIMWNVGRGCAILLSFSSPRLWILDSKLATVGHLSLNF